MYDLLATQPKRTELGWEEDTGLLTLVFFLLYCRCNVEKVPCNSQLEIEGNRSGSALYSLVSKHRYPLVHRSKPMHRLDLWEQMYLVTTPLPPSHLYREWGGRYIYS